MPTYKLQIYGDRQYRSQEILIDGVNSGNAALDVARARYPGANIKAARLVDNYDIGRREAHNQREAERKRMNEEQNQRFRDQEERIKSSSQPTQVYSSGTHQSSYDNNGSDSSMDPMALLGLIVICLAIAYWYVVIPALVVIGIVWWLIRRAT